jgi:organic hydroperoxide reductase OsmC/OhrA
MLDFPHQYFVAASGWADGDVPLGADRLPIVHSAPPVEFGGPGDRWSPETLQVAAVAGCFVLTFRGIARASRLSWSSIRCDVAGTLDRVDGVTQFTAFHLQAHLRVPALTDTEQARHALEKAERRCLIANSLKATFHLQAAVGIESESRAMPDAAIA